MKEEWGPKCIDEFERFWGDMLLLSERKRLTILWDTIQTCSDEEEATLYREAVGILHSVWCRDMAKKGYFKCTLRIPDFDEMGIAPYGISEAKKRGVGVYP